jgi:hypothetical protein
MKNYLVGAVRPVSTTWGYWKTQEEESIARKESEKYQAMYDISRASARKFLQGTWEEVIFQAPVLDNRLYQIAQWYCIKELWFKEPCNILWMGADTLFIKPTEIFGRFKEMRLFNHTDPRQHSTLSEYGDGTGNYFNDDIRYYPATMDQKSWAVGEGKMANWFIPPNNIWDCGQIIHNHQFWCQDIPVNDIFHPELAYQMVKGSVELDNQWNKISIQQAHILHLHGSRNANDRLLAMNQIAAGLGISLTTLNKNTNIINIPV